jgi:YidC/Oxa1 family membrane protein insertase
VEKHHKIFGTLFIIAAFVAFYYSAKYSPPRPNPAQIQAAAAPAAPVTATTTAAEPNLPAFSAPEPAAEFATAALDQAGAHDTVLQNSFIRVSFTDFGGALSNVSFLQEHYRTTLDRSSPPTVFNRFHKDPILAFVNYPGLDRTNRYRLVSKTANAIVYQTVLDGRLEVTRRYVLSPDAVGTTDPYQLRLETTFRNLTGKTIDPLSISLAVGTAPPVNDTTDKGLQLMSGYYNDDSQTFIARAKLEQSGGLFGLGAHGATAEITAPGPMEWATVNNQFFASVLTPDKPDPLAQQKWLEKRTAELVAQGQRPDAAASVAASDYQQKFSTLTIAGLVTRRVKLYDTRPDTDNNAYGITADAQFVLPAIPAGGTALLAGDLYVGPKEYARLSNLDVFKANQNRVVLQMGAFMRFFSALLLTLMTWMHSWASNWGVAIILTTLLLKVAFLPLTLSASRSAKRMQKIQPEMKVIREKFKDSPEKQQAATMALFKQHKVNPVGSCLPMLVTLPFFWAFFRMLSSVAELRFSPFLWAHDLSAPDTVGYVFGFPINILALLLGLTMYLQMHFTPQASVDNSQATMMKFTPLIFMVFCYTYPCALALYSSTNALFSIGQQMIVNRLKDTAAEAPPGKPGGKPTKNVTPGRRR